MKKTASLLLLLAAATILGGCVNKRVSTVTDNRIVESVRSGSIPNGQARVFVHSGKIVGNMFKKNHGAPGQVNVNGIAIGRLNEGDVIVFDLKPGEYELSWTALSVRDHQPDQESVTIPQKRYFAAGSETYLRADWDPASLANPLHSALTYALFGDKPRNILVESSKSESLANNIVSASLCPPAICSGRSEQAKNAPPSKAGTRELPELAREGVVKSNDAAKANVAEVEQVPSSQKLRELKNLLDEGIITQAEFDKKKTEILNSY